MLYSCSSRTLYRQTANPVYTRTSCSLSLSNKTTVPWTHYLNYNQLLMELRPAFPTISSNSWSCNSNRTTSALRPWDVNGPTPPNCAAQMARACPLLPLGRTAPQGRQPRSCTHCSSSWRGLRSKQENESETRNRLGKFTNYYKQVNVLQSRNTCCHVLWSSIPKCAHNSRGNMALIVRRAILRQPKIRNLCIIVQLLTVPRKRKR